jgi:hypothetical protein
MSALAATTPEGQLALILAAAAGCARALRLAGLELHG